MNVSIPLFACVQLVHRLTDSLIKNCTFLKVKNVVSGVNFVESEIFVILRASTKHSYEEVNRFITCM